MCCPASYVCATAVTLLGIEMDNQEYDKLWSFFDTVGRGRLAYVEFNNKGMKMRRKTAISTISNIIRLT